MRRRRTTVRSGGRVERAPPAGPALGWRVERAPPAGPALGWRAARAFWAGVALLVASCSEVPPTEEGPVAAGALPALDLVHSTEQGLEFGELRYFDVDADGTVAVLDRQNLQLVLVDTLGGYRVLGRPGSGPGELGGGGGVAFVGDGSVAVLDPPNGRITRWDREGEVVGTAPAPGIFSEGLMARNGRIFLKARAVGVSEVGPGLDSWVLHWPADSDDPRPDTLFLLASRIDWTSYARPDTVSCGPCPFLPLSHDRILIGEPARNRYRFWALDTDGRVTATLGRDTVVVERHTQETWTRQDARFNQDARLRRTSFGMPDNVARRPRADEDLPMLGATGFPFPLGVDGDGRFWVLRTTTDLTRSFFDVFGADHELLGQVELDDAWLTSIRIQGEWLAGRVEDEWGRAGVRLYRIVEPRIESDDVSGETSKER